MNDDNSHAKADEHSGDAFEANDMVEEEDALEQYLPLRRQVAEDAARWRLQHTATVEESNQRLRTRLATHLDGYAWGTPTVHQGAHSAATEEERHLDQLAHGDRPRRVGQAAEVSEAGRREPRSLARGLRPRGRSALAIGAVAAVLLLGVVGTVIVMMQQPATRGIRPPSLYTWSAEAAYSSKTPQDAFAAAMKLTPCEGARASTATITWLATGRNYGLALIRATCMQREQPYAIWWLFSLGRGAEQHWSPQAGYVVSTRNAGNEGSPGSTNSPAVSAGQTPPWLSLPPDSYAKAIVPGPRGLQPEASVVAWHSPSRTFVFGHVADQAIEPATAMPVLVAEHSGWATEQNGVAIVTLPLSDGTMFFCAGTGSIAQVEGIASLAVVHMDELLTLLTGSREGG